MTSRRSLPVLVAVLLFAAPSVARANDGAFGGSGASLAPLASTPIRMVREDIVMELRGRPLAWDVTAHYEFENPTDEAVTVQMGYPETRCDAEEGDCVGHGGRFRGLRTRVRGRVVRERIGRVSESSPWAQELDRVHLFDVSFAPRERVTVDHHYVYDRSFTAVMGENVYYLTRTGALWNGPIGEARFTVRTPEPLYSVEHPGVFRLVQWDRRVMNGRGMSELVFEARSFTAEVDFGLLLGSVMRLEIGEPIGDGSFDATVCYLSGLTGPMRPSTRVFFDEWLRDAPPEDLAACRNLVFALSGYTFRNERWTRAFYGARPRPGDMGEGWVVEPLRPATRFTQAQLPRHHGTIVRAIQRELARRGAAPTDPGGD
jgi:hypothetical protein